MTNWIIAPVRNGIEYTKAAYDTFIHQDIGDVRVMLIDNASTDGTMQWALSRPLATILYLHQSTPRGVASCWNRGLKYVLAQEDYALVCNNDVLLRPDTYRLLVEDGGLMVTAVGNGDLRCIDPPYNPPQGPKRPHPDMSCFLIRRECWERVGPFDEKFEGAYCEDLDYHIRMHHAGIGAGCIDLPFYHTKSGTIKSADIKEADAIRERAERNRAYFKQKWGCEVGSKEYYALFSAPSEAAGVRP